MTTEQPKSEQQPSENLADVYIRSACFGPPPEACRQLPKPSPETEQNLVTQFVVAANFGLKRKP